MQTIRFRLTVTYTVVLFALTVLVLGGVYLALRANTSAEPPNTFSVQKWKKDSDGEWHLKPGQIEAADITSMQNYANYLTLQKLGTYALGASGVVFVVSLGTGWWLSGRVLRPVRTITATAQEITATDLSRRINLQGPRDELSRLSDTVDDMLGRLEGAFSAQRQMVDDASHELRNPLAIIQANVDAVLAHEDATPEARTQAASIVTRAIARMTNLVEDLLASARRSSPAFVDVDVDLAQIANEAAEEYALIAASRDLRLLRRLSPGPTAAGDPQALRRAVDNLLSNAVRMAPGESELVLAVGSRAGWAWIALRDEGPGISEEDQELVFDRFFRSDRRTAVDGVPTGLTGERRAGLGLAIVRQIVESHGGSVAVHSAVGVGSTFVLWLPDRSLADAHHRLGSVPSEDPLGPRVLA
jgi:signal transduction histidine kinase